MEHMANVPLNASGPLEATSDAGNRADAYGMYDENAMDLGRPGGVAGGGGNVGGVDVQQVSYSASLAAPQPGEDVWVEATTADGRVYYYHAATRESIWERPAKGRVLSHRDLQQLAKPGVQPNAQPAGVPGANLMEQNAAGLGAYPMPAMINNVMMGSFPGMIRAPAPLGGRPQSSWLEYFTPEGRPYYFNPLTGETSWTKPSEAKNGVPGADVAVNAAGVGAAVAASDKSTKLAGDVKVAAGREDSKQPSVGAASEEGPKPVVQAAQKHDRSRPISSNPVAGTAWCVVWTGDYKVFFYNPTTRTSVWERPPELYGRPDVELLISKPPERKKTDGSNSKAPPAVQPIAMGTEGSTVPVEVKQESAKKKRKKIDVVEPAESKPAAPVKVEAEVDKPKDGALEAELKAAQERAQIPLEVRTAQFKAMLEEKNVSAFSTWEKELYKIVFDPRYLLLTSKERKTIFEEYVKERADQERAARKKKLKEAKESFQQLLEEAELTYKSVFDDFVTEWGKDERFKLIEKNRDREALFDEYIRALRLKKREEEQALLVKQKTDFFDLLKEQGNVKRRSRWAEVKKCISSDSRYRQVDSGVREDWFREYCKVLPSENSDDEEEEARKERLKLKERKLREEIAQKAREQEVAAELESQMKERSREMEKHLMQDAEDNFKALLADLIKSTDQTWRDCKKRLRKDSRWESADLLDRQRKQEMFDEHLQQLEAKYRDGFLQLLEETSEINLDTTWKEAKKLIRKDPRYLRYAVSDRKCERQFRDFVRDKLTAAKGNFVELLKESKLITARSKQMMQEDEQHLKDILSALENDKRYLTLECVPREREKLLENYLEQLAESKKACP